MILFLPATVIVIDSLHLMIQVHPQLSVDPQFSRRVPTWLVRLAFCLNEKMIFIKSWSCYLLLFIFKGENK